MKSFFFLSTIVFLLSIGLGTGNAQHDKGKHHLTEVKKTFLLEKLQLSKEEESAFWPLYNAYEEDRRKIRNAYKSIKNQSLDSTTTEKEVKQNLVKLMDLKQEELNIEKKYVEKFLKVLPPRKVTQVFLIDKEFVKALYKRVAEKSESAQPHK